jgi:DNA-binding transcriptional LysR family regulator
MFSNQISLNPLRIFESVYRLKSMSKAALELHLTQSGVSQHMAHLEEQLGVRLFDRLKQKLVATTAADQLYIGCAQGLGTIQSAIEQITDPKKTKLSGRVSIGVPIEFGNNWILPLVSQFAAGHPALDFSFRYGFATEMNDRLLNGDLDFALVDEFAMDQSIEVTPVFEEELVLCGALPSDQKFKATPEFLESQTYVDLQSNAPLIRRWMSTFAPKVHIDRLRVRAWAMDIQGLTRMIENGLGLGVLPRYMIEARIQSQAIRMSKQTHKTGTPVRILTPSGDSGRLINSMRLARVRSRTHSRASRLLMDYLLEKLKKGTSK